MEWTTPELRSVRDLFYIVHRDRNEDIWKSLIECVNAIATKSDRWKTWWIAQALLFTQTTDWSLWDWDSNLDKIRTWRDNNPDCSITSVSQPAQVYELIQLVGRRSTYEPRTQSRN